MTKHFAAHLVFSILTSGVMSLIVCGVATLNAEGASATALHNWLGAWLLAWPIAFVAIAVLAPLIRRNVNRWFGLTG